MKKGFTLAELMGVIFILGIIALIIIPVVDNSIKEGKEDLYNSQITTINLGLQNWAIDNKLMLPDDGEEMTLTLQQLKQGNYVDVDIKNPKTNYLFPNDMLLKISNVDGNFKYSVLENTGTNKNISEYSTDFPTISLNGDKLIYLDVNEPYSELGAIAKDSNGNNLGVSINISGSGSSVNTSVKGNKYVVLYKVSNGEYVNAVARDVIIKDMTPPLITVPKNTSVSLLDVSSFDLMEGVSVTDNSGEVITATTTDRISNIPMTYTIKYEAIDSSGNKSTVTRYITVTGN